MASAAQTPSHNDTPPFLLQLYYRNGTFHRPEDFASHAPPPSVEIYTWSDCTLSDLALELAAAKPMALPNPAIGTRLVFQLVFPDLRSASAANYAQPRYAVKDLGSVVIGEGGPGAEMTEDVDMGAPSYLADKDKTLGEARFVVGDYVSCAILPPLPNGSVAPTSNAKRDSGVNHREGRGGFRGVPQSWENGLGRGGSRGGRGVWRESRGGGFPMGDWRRGERVPESGGLSRGRGQW